MFLMIPEGAQGVAVLPTWQSSLKPVSQYNCSMRRASQHAIDQVLDGYRKGFCDKAKTIARIGQIRRDLSDVEAVEFCTILTNLYKASDWVRRQAGGSMVNEAELVVSCLAEFYLPERLTELVFSQLQTGDEQRIEKWAQVIVPEFQWNLTRCAQRFSEEALNQINALIALVRSKTPPHSSTVLFAMDSLERTVEFIEFQRFEASLPCETADVRTTDGWLEDLLPSRFRQAMGVERMTMIPVWGPIQGMLDSFESSDMVLRCLNLSGLSGFNLSESDDFSHKTRKRAYLRQAEKMLSTLSEQDQWRAVGAAAQFIRQHDETGALVPDALRRVGWKFEREKFSRIDEPDHARPAFFPSGDTHDAYLPVRSVLQTAESNLLIIDPWPGPRIYALIATVKGLKHCRLLCGVRTDADFIQEAEAFADQYAAITLEIRASRDFHDRFVFANGKVFLFGASIEHAGQRAFSVVPVEDGELSKYIRDYTEKVWTSATGLFPRPRAAERTR
jgi:hypothetical protein